MDGQPARATRRAGSVNDRGRVMCRLKHPFGDVRGRHEAINRGRTPRLDALADDSNTRARVLGHSKGRTEAAGAEAVSHDEIEIRIALGRGEARDRVWTCDFSHEYVTINAEYRT